MHKLSENNKPHNSLYLISPDGKVKGQMINDSVPMGIWIFFLLVIILYIEINGVICSLLICYDIRFPSLQGLRKLNVDIIFQSFYNARQKAAVFIVNNAHYCPGHGSLKLLLYVALPIHQR